MPTNSRAGRHFWSLSASPVLVLRLLLAGIMLSTGVGVLYAGLNRPAFQNSFPGASTPVVYAAFLVVAGGGFLALIGLWYWRRWAVVLYGGLTVASLVLDVIARAPVVHQIAVVLGASAVLTLVYVNRARFGADGSPGAV